MTTVFRDIMCTANNSQKKKNRERIGSLGKSPKESKGDGSTPTKVINLIDE